MDLTNHPIVFLVSGQALMSRFSCVMCDWNNHLFQSIKRDVKMYMTFNAGLDMYEIPIPAFLTFLLLTSFTIKFKFFHSIFSTNNFIEALFNFYDY